MDIENTQKKQWSEESIALLKSDHDEWEHLKNLHGIGLWLRKGKANKPLVVPS